MIIITSFVRAISNNAPRIVGSKLLGCSVWLTLGLRYMRFMLNIPGPVQTADRMRRKIKLDVATHARTDSYQHVVYELRRLSAHDPLYPFSSIHRSATATAVMMLMMMIIMGSHGYSRTSRCIVCVHRMARSPDRIH